LLSAIRRTIVTLIPSPSPLSLTPIERARALHVSASSSLETSRMLLADAQKSLPKIERQAIMTISAAHTSLALLDTLDEVDATTLRLLSQSTIRDALAQVRVAQDSVTEWVRNVASSKDSTDNARTALELLLA
jgi:hypothetical protein